MTTAPNLDHRLQPLRESGRFNPELLDLFARWVATAPDEQLFRVNPLAFATAQKVSDRDAIDLFVHAAHAGIFDFVWGLICPACRGFVSAREGLRSVSTRRRCAMCEIETGENLDYGVEVSFTISRGVRQIRFHGGWSGLVNAPSGLLIDDILTLYFSGAKLQAVAERVFRRGMQTTGVIKRGEKRTLRFDYQPDELAMWRVMAPATHSVARLVSDPNGPSKASMEIADGRMIPDELALKPGPVELEVTQRTEDAELVFGVVALTMPEPLKEDELVSERFLSGKRLLSTQSFRDLFRTETLAPGASMQIQALAMLFTDLKASTQLYERVGDLQALAMVREHFDLLRDVVDRHEGAVVKTIGDAVMATFVDPRQAAMAAIEMHQVVTRIRPEELQLKVGVHLGPCVAVDSNERLDYFGQTVNIAARVQALAEGRELVLTDAMLAWPGVAEVLRAAKLAPAREEAQLKGIANLVTVHRSTVG